MSVELTERQREILLRGLRFVRSSRMLEVRDPDVQAAAERRSELSEIGELSRMLESGAAQQARV